MITNYSKKSIRHLFRFGRGKIKLIVFLLFFSALALFTPSHSFARDNKACTNLRVKDNLGNDWQNIDPKADQIIWNVDVGTTDSNKTFYVGADNHVGGFDYEAEIPNNNGHLNGVITRSNERQFDTSEENPQPHSLLFKIKSAKTPNGTPVPVPDEIYCNFDAGQNNPAYIVVYPPPTYSATCSLTATSNGDFNGKGFTTDSDIFVWGIINPRGFGSTPMELSFGNRSMRVVRPGPDSSEYYISDGDGLRHVNYRDNKNPNSIGDNPIEVVSDIGVQLQEGIYTIYIDKASLPSLSQQVTGYIRNMYIRAAYYGSAQQRDKYNRWYRAPFQCNTKFKISNDGTGGVLTPTPTISPIPAPTNPDFCTDPKAQCNVCAPGCESCSWCKINTPTSIVPIPTLVELCNRLTDEKYRDACKACDMKEGKIWTAVGCVSTDFGEIITNVIFKTGSGVAGGISFLYLIYGAFLMLTSAGNPERIEEAKQIIISALSGMFLIIFSIFLLEIVGIDILGLPGFHRG